MIKFDLKINEKLFLINYFYLLNFINLYIKKFKIIIFFYLNKNKIMGLFLEKMCCIEQNEILENQQYSINKNNNNSNKSSNSKFKYKTKKSDLPENEIKFNSPNRREIINTINQIQINSSNVIRQQKGKPFDYYYLIKILGKGGYGQVFKVKHKRTGMIRAMKIIPKNNLQQGCTDEDIEKEINILKKLEHPNIIKLFEFFIDDQNYYLINEYCSDGDLSEKLYEIKFFPEYFVKNFMFQIFNAVRYLHSQHVFHGDLKLENIMVDSVSDSNYMNESNFMSTIKEENNEIKHSSTYNEYKKKKHKNNILSKSVYHKSKLKNFELKLIDFGCSKMFTKYKKNFGEIIGTTIYCSPEVLLNNYDKSCDIWSCGIIMYYLLVGHFPFYGKNENEIIDKIQNSNFSFNHKQFDNVSLECKDLITKCLDKNSKTRITIDEVVKHPFFSDNINPNNLYEDKIETKKILQKLQNYRKHSKFFEAVLAFLTHNFADKTQVSTIKKVFTSIDENLDGVVSKEELIKSFKNEGIKISKKKFDEIFNLIDADNSGVIEYEEFIRVTIQKEHLFTDNNLRAAFDLFDLDKNGSISLNEVETVLSNGKNMDKNVLKELMTEIKKTGDEEITFEQFKEMMMNFAEDDIKYYKQFSSSKKIKDIREIININDSININEYNYDDDDINISENDKNNVKDEKENDDESEDDFLAKISMKKSVSNLDFVNQ